MGPGRSERKKEQTAAGAAGRGAKPGRAVVGWCGRKREGRRRRWLGRRGVGRALKEGRREGEFYLFIYFQFKFFFLFSFSKSQVKFQTNSSIVSIYFSTQIKIDNFVRLSKITLQL